MSEFRYNATQSMMEHSEPIIRTEGLTKEFGNLSAVSNVDFEAREGEIMALVGDNGAGKSTLIKMLCGVVTPTAGKIFLKGDEVHLDNYNQARNFGIGTVYQDLALARSQTVAANVFLGDEPFRKGVLGKLGLVDEDRMISASSEALERVKIPVDPQARVRNLSGGQQQAVAIARALQFDPEILIMDEPTSALSIEGVRNVQEVIRNLNDSGITIILISHNIEEVMGVSDRITVLHQGKINAVLEADSTDRQEIVFHMMGGRVDEPASTPAEGEDAAA